MTTNFETISVDKSGVGFFYKKETDSEHFVPSSWRSRTSPTTLPGTELSRDFSKVTVDTSRTLGGMLKKNIQLHIFLAQVKRHGLVVVSGMALGEFMGNIEGYIIWISILLHRNTFNCSQVAGTKPSRCLLMLRGENHRQQKVVFFCFSPTQDQNTSSRMFHRVKISDFNLQTNI